MNGIKSLVDYFYNMELNGLSKTEEKYNECYLSGNFMIRLIKYK